MGRNGAKTIPFGAAHTYMANVRDYPHGRLRLIRTAARPCPADAGDDVQRKAWLRAYSHL